MKFKKLNLRNLAVVVMLCTMALNAEAQQNYYTFSVNGLNGIVDSVGKEVETPVHKYDKVLTQRNEIVMSNYRDRKDLIFDMNTGKKQFVDYIHTGDLTINGNSYSHVDDKGKSYFRSEESNKTININKDYYRYSNVGDYITAKYSNVVEIPRKPITAKGKNGVPAIQPPPKYDFQDGIVFFDGKSESFTKPLLKGIFDKYTPVYEKPETKQEGNDIIAEKVITVDLSKPKSFDYIILSNKNKHSVYDSKLKLIKKFDYKAEESEELAIKAGEVLSKNLSSFDSKNGGFLMAPPSGVRSDYVEKIRYPVFEVKKENDDKNTLVIKKSETESVEVLSTPLKIRYNVKEYYISLEDKDVSTTFYFDPETGEIHLPKKYWEKFGITKK